MEADSLIILSADVTGDDDDDDDVRAQHADLTQEERGEGGAL